MRAVRGLGLLQDVGETALRPATLVSDSFRQRAVLAETGHRPWQLPRRPWFMGQSWLDLLFAHWPVPEEALREVVPPQLPVDTYEGTAWLGVTPFCVRGLRLRGTVPAPGISTFPELNVRTYVSVEGKPGIYFLSLDADSSAAVWAARRSYRLPYFRSRIRIDRDEEGISYDLLRTSHDGPPAYFVAKYGAEGDELPIREGSLERWLTERYCLYTLDDEGRIQRGDIHHPPWPLRRGWAEIETNTMAMPFGIELEGEPLLHFSPRQDVVIWTIQPV
ncbi:MAG: YqjF family protein [Solirubrobacterales bacterium]